MRCALSISVPIYFAHYISPTLPTETPRENVASSGALHREEWPRQNLTGILHAYGVPRLRSDIRVINRVRWRRLRITRKPHVGHHLPHTFDCARNVNAGLGQKTPTLPDLGCLCKMQDEAALIVQVARYMRLGSPCGSFYSSAHLFGCALRPWDRAMFCSAGGVSRMRQRKERREPGFLCIAAHTGCHGAGWAGKWFRASPW